MALAGRRDGSRGGRYWQAAPSDRRRLRGKPDAATGQQRGSDFGDCRNDHAARDPLRDGEAVCAAKDRALQPRVTRWGEGPDLPSGPFETLLPYRPSSAAPYYPRLPSLFPFQVLTPFVLGTLFSLLLYSVFF